MILCLFFFCVRTIRKLNIQIWFMILWKSSIEEAVEKSPWLYMNAVYCYSFFFDLHTLYFHRRLSKSARSFIIGSFCSEFNGVWHSNYAIRLLMIFFFSTLLKRYCGFDCKIIAPHSSEFKWIEETYFNESNFFFMWMQCMWHFYTSHSLWFVYKIVRQTCDFKID